jgi:hypothetical protein
MLTLAKIKWVVTAAGAVVALILSIITQLKEVRDPRTKPAYTELAKQVEQVSKDLQTSTTRLESEVSAIKIYSLGYLDGLKQMQAALPPPKSGSTQKEQLQKVIDSVKQFKKLEPQATPKALTPLRRPKPWDSIEAVKKD